MIKLFYSSQPSLSFLASIDSRVRATYNQGADSAEGGDALAGTVVELDLDEVLLGLFQS